MNAAEKKVYRAELLKNAYSNIINDQQWEMSKRVPEYEAKIKEQKENGEDPSSYEYEEKELNLIKEKDAIAKKVAEEILKLF